MGDQLITMAWVHGDQSARLRVDFGALEAEISCSGQAPITYRSTGAICRAV